MDISGIKVRGLTRREIKNLEADGITLSEVKSNDLGTVDKLLDICCTPAIEDKEALTPAQCLKLFTGIVDRTYLTVDAEKNSEGPQS
jgi:hypothetical protein